MPSRTHCPTHAIMEWMVNKKKEDGFFIIHKVTKVFHTDSVIYHNPLVTTNSYNF